MWDEVKSFSEIEEDRNHRQLAIDRFADVEHYLDDRVPCALAWQEAMQLVGAEGIRELLEDVGQLFYFASFESINSTKLIRFHNSFLDR